MTGRRALVVRGGWDGHHPVAATEMFIPHLEANGFAVEVSETRAPFADADLMAQVDLVVQCTTMSTIEDAEVAGLRAAVTAGTGLAGWHGGIADSYRASADYLQLVGGQFTCHPSKAPDQVSGEQSDNYLPHRIDVLPEAADHPITTGISSFELVTEQYWVLSDDLNDVLATTTHPVQPHHPWHRPVVSPAVWTRQWGEGRIFVATPGHDPDVLAQPDVRTIVERGLLWASR